MKEEKIKERIKQLQNDSKFTFKLTKDIIDSVYRIALEDAKKENNNKNVGTTKEFIKEIKSKKIYDDELIEELKAKEKKMTYIEVVNYIKAHFDLMDVYIHFRELAEK